MVPERDLEGPDVEVLRTFSGGESLIQRQQQHTALCGDVKSHEMSETLSSLQANEVAASVPWMLAEEM